jgi:catechol-2,3-dioxygenase
MAFNAPNGRTHHELLLIEVGASASPIPGGRRVGLYHFGLKIGESDDELREALAAPRANDVNIMSSTDHGMTHSIYITDPDGNEIELHIDVPDVDWSDRTLWTTYRHKALRLLPKFAIRFASRVGSC